MKRRFYIGTAGWAVPTTAAERCPGAGTHLQRYARVFQCAEINTTFYRPHEEATYWRWARSTGPSFRFAVKVPRLITHELRLRGAAAPLDRFLATHPTRKGPAKAGSAALDDFRNWLMREAACEIGYRCGTELFLTTFTKGALARRARESPAAR